VRRFTHRSLFSKRALPQPPTSVARETPPGPPLRYFSATVQFSVVGATSRTIAFPAVHVQFALPTVYKLVVL
jgi:hypothetical protein